MIYLHLQYNFITLVWHLLVGCTYCIIIGIKFVAAMKSLNIKSNLLLYFSLAIAGENTSFATASARLAATPSWLARVLDGVHP